MLNNLKLIFVHGVNEQTTNYSHEFYQNILSISRSLLKQQNLEQTAIENIVQHETLWTDITTDRTNRYRQLQGDYRKFNHLEHPRANSFLDRIKEAFIYKRIIPLIIDRIDPLAMQIMQYIKDKGEKDNEKEGIKGGEMNILKEFDRDIKKIFLQENDNIGRDPIPGEGENAIIIAHSLGSLIAYDYLMGFRKYKLKTEIDKKKVTIRSFITMGSPIPVFISAMGHPDSDIKLPENVNKWVNIISPVDGIARYMKPFFRNITIEEHSVYTGWDPLGAHNGYWKDKKTAEIIAHEVVAALK